MEILAAAVATCSTCHQPLSVKGKCLACLLRGGLEETAPASDSLDSLVFGDFEIARRADGSFWELGCGAMGVTYRATDKVLHRTVALKVIETPSAAGDSTAVRERFLREARAAAALRHPNVAGVFQFGAVPEIDRCYYAMELVEGETLEARVRRDGPLEAEVALEISIQVARALTEAAAQGLVHRDLKPSNIMLTQADAGTAQLGAKVIDFGLAKATNAVAETDLTHGGFVGTPSFASPEQFDNATADARSDIYSLGVTFWYALTSQVPYPGKTIEEIRDRQQRSDLPVEQLAERKIPAPLIEILRRALAIDPTQRPASARELLEALESCRAKLVWPNEFTPRRTVRKIAALIVTFAIAPAILFAFVLLRQKTRVVATKATPLTEKSIAVLPFENLSKEAENAFFAGGVQDELLSDLAQIADLKVISRTSVMQYQGGGERNLREIGRTLGVANVVEGSVQRSGHRVRVVAQLIDARTDAHLWAETYDRDLADVFTIQSEIAQKIADQLRAKLSPNEKSALTEHPTADLRAYQLYIEAKALSDWNSDFRETATRQIELLEEATRRDPNFALAYGALACAHQDLNFLGDHKHLEMMKQAAETALRLRPDLGEARLALARSYFLLGDYPRARAELTIIHRTLPNDAVALLIEAKIDRRENRWEDALATARKASDLDPRNGEIFLWICETLDQMRRYEEGEQLLQQGLARLPELRNLTQNHLADLKLDAGDPMAAKAILAQLPQDFSPDADPWDSRFTTALYLHDYDAADRSIAATPARWATEAFIGQPPQSWADGQIARARGDNKKAQAAFAAAREWFNATRGGQNEDEFYLARIALLDAGLGRKEQAIREAKRSVDLMPITKDSWIGPRLVGNLALVYAWTGERDLAIKQLAMVAKIPFGPSYGDLRFNPCWDSLRGDPRFEKMVASLAPK